VATRKLTRSVTDRKLGGVCAGIADYFEIDPVLVRVAFVVLAISGGFGVLAYVILWIIVPEAPTGAPTRGRSAAIEIAEERYARGEISADELARIRADLGAGA
jgi:phage shock protein C